MTLLRKAKQGIGVDLYVVTLIPGEAFDASSIRASVEKALINVLSFGFLGSYRVHFAGPNDIQVEESLTGMWQPCLLLFYGFV